MLRSTSIALCSLLLAGALWGCGDDSGTTDSGLDGATPIDSGGTPEAGPKPDGGPDTGITPDSGPMPDAAMMPDAGGGPDGVHCLGAEGDCAAGEVCCGSSTGTSCVASADMCTGDALACDGAEDCPGQICCSETGGTSCTDTCSGYTICNDDVECPDGYKCCPNGGGVPFGALSHCMMLAVGEMCPLPP